MTTAADLLDMLAASSVDLTLAELLAHHPDVARRTAQRWISQLIAEGLSLIDAAVSAKVPKPEQTNVKALIVEELRRLHEGVLARYGLRPSEFTAWKKRQKAG